MVQCLYKQTMLISLHESCGFIVSEIVVSMDSAMSTISHGFEGAIRSTSKTWYFGTWKWRERPQWELEYFIYLIDVETAHGEDKWVTQLGDSENLACNLGCLPQVIVAARSAITPLPCALCGSSPEPGACQGPQPRSFCAEEKLDFFL